MIREMDKGFVSGARMSVLFAFARLIGGCSGHISFGEFGPPSEPDADEMDASDSSAPRPERDEAIEETQLSDVPIDAIVAPDAPGPTCGQPVTETTVQASGRVIPLYLSGSDTPDEVAQARLIHLRHGLTAAQTWFGQAMATDGGAFRTFRFESPRILKSKFTNSQWNDFAVNGFLPADAGTPGCGLWDAARDDLSNGGALARAGLPPLATPGVAYLVVAGGGATSGCVGPELAVLEEMTFARIEARCPNGIYDGCTRGCADPGGLADIDPWCNESPHSGTAYACSSIGGIAYDLGIEFGLRPSKERPAADAAACAGRTIMDGWWDYGLTASLCEADKIDLVASGFFAAL
jgi:hypothetical protein